MPTKPSKPTVSLMPPPSGDPPVAPAPLPPQLMTVALLCASKDGCDCAACQALRRLADAMTQEVMNA